MDSAVWVALIGALPLTITAVGGLAAVRRTRAAELATAAEKADKERIEREAQERQERDQRERRRVELERAAAEQLAAAQGQRAEQLSQLVGFYAKALEDEREHTAELRSELRDQRHHGEGEAR